MTPIETSASASAACSLNMDHLSDIKAMLEDLVAIATPAAIMQPRGAYQSPLSRDLHSAAYQAMQADPTGRLSGTPRPLILHVYTQLRQSIIDAAMQQHIRAFSVLHDLLVQQRHSPSTPTELHDSITIDSLVALHNLYFSFHFRILASSDDEQRMTQCMHAYAWPILDALLSIESGRSWDDVYSQVLDAMPDPGK